MTIRKRACKALAYNLAAGLAENIEILWQQEIYKLSDEEVDYTQQQMKQIAKMLANHCNYDELRKIERV